MAIQAQYPSNLLHVQEGKCPFGNVGVKADGGGGGGGGGGLIADQTNALFNYTVGTNHTRKRRRETDSPLMSTQQQPHQFYTSQKNVVSTGLGLAFNDHHLQQQQQQMHRQQQYSVSPQCSTHSSVQQSLLSDELDPYIKQQRNEIEHFLLAQGEQLRRALAEKRQRHYRTLLSAAEEALTKRLKEKEAEVGKAVRRHAELEAKMNHLNLEAQAWQARARMQENYAAALQLQLQQAIIAGGCGGRGQGGGGGGFVQEGDEYGGGGGGGEGSSAGVVGNGDAEDAESAYIDPDRVVISGGPICKSCRKRAASMVLLPCRHLCLCTECDAVAQACPACLTVRSSSIEVIMS